MAVGDMSVVSQICTSWGIGSMELFQTMVRGRASHVPANAVNSSGNEKMLAVPAADTLDDMVDPLKNQVKQARSSRQMNSLVKETLKKLLVDTSKFPKELMLVGRCINYIRAANWTHGSPIDRIAVFADAAREATHANKETASEISAFKKWIIYIASYVIRMLPGGSNYEKIVVGEDEM